MPTYEYRCSNGHQFEQFQKMSDPPVDVCPQCGAPAERLMSAGAGLVFKGSGFYITDYRNDSYKKAAQSDSGGSAGSAGAAPAPAPKPDGGADKSAGKESASPSPSKGGSTGGSTSSGTGSGPASTGKD